MSGKSIEEDRETEEAEELAGECGSLQTAALLERLRGTCDWWAAALKNALAVEGIKSEIIQLQVKYAGGERKVCEVGFECAMLVKNWTFKNPGMGEFPYAPAEVVRTKGVPGQGLENPPAGRAESLAGLMIPSSSWLQRVSVPLSPRQRRERI